MKTILRSKLIHGFRSLRRRAAEAIGSGRYSYNALNDLDRKIEFYLPQAGGFFIEAGANNGFEQSNTYYFEKGRRWSGVLIEPIPELYEKCRLLRTRSQVFHAALVAPDYPSPDIEITFANLMSVTAGAFGDSQAAQAHTTRGIAIQRIDHTYCVRVPARTLTAILDEAKVPPIIDLFTLDVEGYETHALRGLDLEKYRPRFLCVEVRDDAAIDNLVAAYYERVEILCDTGEYRDVLYRSKSENHR